MDLTFIEDLLRRRIDPATGTLTLSVTDAAPLGAPIVALYAGYFNGGPLIVTEAGVNRLTSPDRVLLTGTGGSFPFDGQPIRAYFTVSTIDPANAALDLIVTPASGWTFTDTFPVLGGTVFDTLAFAAPGFALRSEEQASGAKGFAFAGTLLVDGRLAYLFGLLNGTREIPVASAITLEEDAPIFRLLPSGAITSPAIGQFLPFELRLVAGASNDPDQGVSAELTLEGVLTFRSGGVERRITFGVDLLSVRFGVLHFVSNTREADLHLGQIVQLLNGQDAASSLPPVFSVLDNLTLAGWELYLDVNRLQPNAVIARIVTRKPWDLIPDALSLVIDELTLQAARVPDWQFRTDLAASFTLEQDGNPAVISLTAHYPGFEMLGVLTEGAIDVKWLLSHYISPRAGELVGARLEVDRLALYIAPASSSFAFAIAIKTEWPIQLGALGSFTIKGLSLALSRLAQRNSGIFTGNFRLGTVEPPVLADVTAAYDSVDGWRFDGGLTPGSTLPLHQVLQSYFPSWDLSWTTIDVNKLRVTLKPTPSYYRFLVDVLWTLQIGDFTPARIHGIADVAYDGKRAADKYAGFISGDVEIAGLTLGAKVTFPEPQYTLYFESLQVKIDTKPETLLTVTFSQQTLGDLIATLVSAASGRPFTLPAPWNVLNLIELSHFSLQFYPSRTPKEVGIIYAPTPPLNLWFLTLSKFELWYKRNPQTNKSQVMLTITGGSFLGVPLENPIGMDVLDPASAPKVPGAGTQLFELDFLAVGQRLKLKHPTPFTSVTQAMTDLEAAFRKPAALLTDGSPISGTSLVADANAGWLFGLRANLLSAIAVRAVFLDPELYGLAISVYGDRFPKLKNLNFEILYKRVNDTIGVYQLELRVPDFMRQLEFGAVSITLPIIGIEIFTNGNFRLDFGFPAGQNFTRSFAIQVLPFTGAGGFYFGWLNGATAKRIPQTTRGQFNPVIEAGVGLRVGIGREINKGIFRAGLSLTVVGIVEGTLAFYHPNDNDPRYDNAMYFYLSGYVAVVGLLFGEVNFAIIQAEVELQVTIGVTLVFEAYEAIVFTFFARVSVRVSVRVNLGLFSFRISLSFSTSIESQFSMGSRNPNRPWGQSLAHPMANGQPLALGARTPLHIARLLIFHPVTRGERHPVGLWFAPQFTPASDIVDDRPQPAKAQAVVMFYVRTTTGQTELKTPAAFDTVASGALIWTLAAGLFPDAKETPEEDVLDAAISVETLEAILETLTASATNPLFDHQALIAWFERYFTFTVAPAPQRDTDAKASEAADDPVVSVFPMLTPAVLRLPDGQERPFATHERVDHTYFDDVRDYFRRMKIDYLSPERKADLAQALTLARAQRTSSAAAGAETRQPLVGWMMVDYFMALAKGSVQAAIDTLRALPLAAGPRDSLDSLHHQVAPSGVTFDRFVRANLTRPLRARIYVQVPPFWHDERGDATLADTAARFGVPVSCVGADDAPRASGRHRVSRVRVSTVAHAVSGSRTECLLSIARHYAVDPFELAAMNRHRVGLFADGRVWAFDLEALDVRTLIAKMQEQAKFEHLAGSTSRFILNGLRPPAPPPQTAADDRTDEETLTALYQLNGQQFDVSALKPGDSFVLQLPEALPWLIFDKAPASTVLPKDTQHLPVVISEKEAAIIGAFNGAVLDPKIATIAALPFQRTEAKAFGLGNAIAWRPRADPGFARTLRGDAPAGNTQYSLWSFPQDLQQLLLDDPSLQPDVDIVEQTSDAPRLPLYDVQALLPLEFTWATRVDLTIRRVYTTGRTLVPNTYELWGADVGASAALQHLLAFTDETSPIAELHILYEPNPVDNPDLTGLLSASVATTQLFLVQTNLSTRANPGAGFAQAIPGADADAAGGLIGMTALQFVRFVWESSVVRSGGYYVYYRDTVDGAGLPGYLFNAIDEISVSLLVTYRSREAVLQPYMNTVAVTKDVDIERTMFSLRAKGDDPRLLARAQTMPAGAIGLSIVRTPPAPDVVSLDDRLAAEDAAPYIAEAYNLLNYQIAPGGGFDKSPFALSAGPADDSERFNPDPNVSPRPQLTADEWRYKAIVPAYRYASPKADAPASPGADNVPPPQENPYRGLGGTATLEISWLDLFGNRIMTNTPARLSVPIAYFDPLVALDQWPSLTCDYLVARQKSDDAPAVNLRLRFDAARYTTGTEEAARAAVADLARYQLIYFQLTQSGVTASGSASLDNVAHDLLAPLVGFALAIWQFLDALVHARGTPVVPAPLSLDLPVSDTNERQIEQLTVTVVIARPKAQVHGDFLAAADDPVFRVQSAIGARYDEQGVGQPLTLRDFAASLEAAFPQLAVATTAPRAGSNMGGATREIWVARFGAADGITYTPGSPVFIAPLPLSRRLLSTRLNLYPYETGVPIADGTPHEQSVTAVDLDLLARGLLEAIDLFLSPQFVIPAWLAWNETASAIRAGDDNPIQAILTDKQQIAEAIADRVANIFTELLPSPDGLAEARETLKQQLLIRLSDLYTVDAIVQFPVAVTSRFPDNRTAPRLFGTTLAQAPPTGTVVKRADDAPLEDYTFSTSEISLTNQAARSSLTFLFGTRDPSAAAQITLPLAFQRSHIRQEIDAVPGTSYEASRWLAFVTLTATEPAPLRALPSRSGLTDLGTVSIPVPLRAYPPSPALLNQQGIGLVPPRAMQPAEQGLRSTNPDLERARGWTFGFTYQYDSAAQDTIHATVDFNLPPDAASAARAAAADPDLLDALVQFGAVYPALRADLESSLISQPDRTLAVTTMQSFAWLVGRVRYAWAAWPAAGRLLAEPLPELTVKIAMRQHAVTIPGAPAPVFAITVAATSTGRVLHPRVSLDGYETRALPPDATAASTSSSTSRTSTSTPKAKAAAAAGDAWTQTYIFVKNDIPLSDEQGRRIPVRTVEIPDLDILLEQNGRAALHIRRNEDLSDTYTTNEAFVYETPDVRFGSVLAPLLQPDLAIDVAASSTTPPPTDQLYHYLLAFLVDLFTPAAGNALKSGLLRVHGGFSYALDHGPEETPFEVTLPVFLTDPTAITIPDADGRIADPPAVPAATLARAMADRVLDWAAERELVGRDGDLRLDLTLYAPQADDVRPMLELTASLDMTLVWRTTPTL